MSTAKQIGAGLAAGAVVAGGAVSPIPQGQVVNTNEFSDTNETPAIHQTIQADSPYAPKSEEQLLGQLNNELSNTGFVANMPDMEQYEPSTAQKMGELGNSVRDLADAHSDLISLENDAREGREQDNALQGPGYADHTDEPNDNKGINAFREKSAEAKGAELSSSNKGIDAFREKSADMHGTAQKNEVSGKEQIDEQGQKSENHQDVDVAQNAEDVLQTTDESMGMEIGAGTDMDMDMGGSMDMDGGMDIGMEI